MLVTHCIITTTACLPKQTSTLSSSHKDQLCVSRYLLLETRKDGTKFTNRQMKDTAERLQTATSKYDELQKDLIQQVSWKGGECGLSCVV